MNDVRGTYWYVPVPLHVGLGGGLVLMIGMIFAYLIVLVPAVLLALPGGLALRAVANNIGPVSRAISYGDAYKGAFLTILVQSLGWALTMLILLAAGFVLEELLQSDRAAVVVFCIVAVLAAVSITVPAAAVLRMRMPWAFGDRGGWRRALVASLAVFVTTMVIAALTGVALGVLMSRSGATGL